MNREGWQSLFISNLPLWVAIHMSLIWDQNGKHYRAWIGLMDLTGLLIICKLCMSLEATKSSRVILYDTARWVTLVGGASIFIGNRTHSAILCIPPVVFKFTVEIECRHWGKITIRWKYIPWDVVRGWWKKESLFCSIVCFTHTYITEIGSEWENSSLDAKWNS